MASRFPSFDASGTQKWTLYYQKFLFHCERHGLATEAQKKAELLSIASDEFFEFCQAVCRRELHDETLTFARICTSVEEHLCPQPNEIVAAGKFTARRQQPGESVADFVADLRKLARPANYGEAQDRMIRDRLCLGLANPETQAWLFRIRGLTLDKALETALSVEESNNNVAETADTTVNWVSKQQQQQNKGKPTGTGANHNARLSLCHRCDYGDHSPDECRHVNSRCNHCQNLGHIERACRKKREAANRANSSTGRQRGEKPNYWRGKQRKPRAQANAVNSTPEQQGLHNQQASPLPGGTPNQQAPQANANFMQASMTSWGDEYGGCWAITPQVEVTNIPTKSVSEWDLPKPRYMELSINGCKLKFQVDTACPVTMMGEQVFSRVFPENTTIQKSDLALGMWDNAPVKDLGFVWIKLTVDGVQHTLRLYIGKGQGACLLGRQWFNALKIRLETDAVLNVVPSVQPTIQPTMKTPANFSDFECFRPGLGCYRGPPVSLRIQPTARPRRLKARKVAFARTQAVELEIRRMVEEQVWRGPLETAEWSTPVVPVFKEDRPRPRLCCDYRSTLNPVVEMDEYPMPTIEEAFSAHAGCVVFSKLDLSDAYTQLPVDEATAKVLTVCTHKGLFSVHRLPFGICSGPAIFQRRMCDLLADVEGVIVWLDDILVAGPTQDIHDKRLREVLKRLSEAGLRLHPTKCEFSRESLEYLGFKMDKNGRTPLRKRVAAILDAPSPKNVSELQSFNGKLVFYDKFLPNRATVFEPLYRLLERDTPWHWDDSHTLAFRRAKEMLASSELLVHYDLKKDLVLSCDASPVGLGAVLSHVFPDGSERPIEYASRALSKAERNYSQTDREALSIVFAVKKWHRFLAGRRFCIFTDHKPLLGIFGPQRPMPEVVSPRVERWLVLMGCYAYDLKYRPGKEHGNADALSRLCVLGTEPQEVPEPPGVFLITGLHSPHLSAEQVAAETAKDPVLLHVMKWTVEGWPNQSPEGEFTEYFKKRDAITTARGCLLWGSRIIVPRTLQPAGLRHLHAAHMGVVRTKALARILMWWPNITAEIERKIGACPGCQATRCKDPRLPHSPWPEPTGPWQRLHVDFAGPFLGRHFFVVVDAFSGWMDVQWVTGPTTAAAIESLGMSFQYNGFPFTIVSDNGTAFKSHLFNKFCILRGIRQLFTAPQHPSSNGRAERCVRTVKEHLKRLTGNDWKGKLCTILDALRTTPGPDGLSANQKLFKREIKNFFSLCLPKPVICVDGPDLDPKFSVGDPVWFETHNAKAWTPAAVSSLEGKRMALLDNGHRRHFDQMRHRTAQDPPRPPSMPTARPPPNMRILGDLPARTPPATAPHSPPLVTPPESPPEGGTGPQRTPITRKRVYGHGRGKKLETDLRRSERLKNQQPGRPREN